jgi:multidrug efflux pump subunit AcrA (membrane-fusion protein)
MVHAVARVSDPYALTKKDRPPLAIGMFVDATIQGKTFDHIIEIKREALRGENTVWIIDDENKLHFRDIEILRLEEERVLVKKGLQEGEQICLTALDAVVEGMKVNTEE